MEALQLLVADVLCNVLPPHHRDLSSLDQSFRDFVVTSPPDDPGVPVVTVRGHYDGLPARPPRAESLVLDQGIFFRIHFEDGQYLLPLTRNGGTEHFCTAIFGQDFRELNVHHLPTASDSIVRHSLTHPIHALLMASVLSQGYGLSLHACGVADEGRGYLFPGHSGAGKSTMGRLWERHAVVLNDERMVLRERHGQLWIYGTPYRGENSQYANAGVPLDKIFFLHQAPRNGVTALGAADVATRLLSHTLLPYWSRSGMQFVTDFSARLAESASCHLLDFVPDGSVVPFIRCVP
ncbi:MAG: hypothetical protein ABI333_24940 [bacterium]